MTLIKEEKNSQRRGQSFENGEYSEEGRIFRERSLPQKEEAIMFFPTGLSIECISEAPLTLEPTN